jgi:hypothetical protein
MRRKSQAQEALNRGTEPMPAITSVSDVIGTTWCIARKEGNPGGVATDARGNGRRDGVANDGGDRGAEGPGGTNSMRD